MAKSGGGSRLFAGAQRMIGTRVKAGVHNKLSDFNAGALELEIQQSFEIRENNQQDQDALWIAMQAINDANTKDDRLVVIRDPSGKLAALAGFYNRPISWGGTGPKETYISNLASFSPGYGLQALKAITQEANKAGTSRLALQSLLSAKKYYARLGFEQDVERGLWTMDISKANARWGR